MIKKIDLLDQRVTKANALIQKSRFDLTVQQQKIVLYLISQITPYDDDFKLYEFSIPEFCRVCGIDCRSGKNYKDLKEAVQEIADKSMWVFIEQDVETLLRWIEKPYIDHKEGTIRIRLDNDMKPFLLQLKENFTTYELIYTLHFKSKYTIRLYELIKSIHFDDLRSYTRKYSLDTLRRVMGAEKYTAYKNLKQRALEPAVKEINAYSDKILTYKEIKQGRKVIGVEFSIWTKDALERMQIIAEIEQDMGVEQLTLWDTVEGID